MRQYPKPVPVPAERKYNKPVRPTAWRHLLWLSGLWALPLCWLPRWVFPSSALATSRFWPPPAVSGRCRPCCSVQTRLFRFVEERQLRRLGGLEPVRVDCRILCATNQDLAAKIRAGTFREELYYRLGVVTVNLPPLRKRPLLGRASRFAPAGHSDLPVARLRDRLGLVSPWRDGAAPRS